MFQKLLKKIAEDSEGDLDKTSDKIILKARSKRDE